MRASSRAKDAILWERKPLGEHDHHQVEWAMMLKKDGRDDPELENAERNARKDAFQSAPLRAELSSPPGAARRISPTCARKSYTYIKVGRIFLGISVICVSYIRPADLNINSHASTCPMPEHESVLPGTPKPFGVSRSFKQDRHAAPSALSSQFFVPSLWEPAMCTAPAWSMSPQIC